MGYQPSLFCGLPLNWKLVNDSFTVPERITLFRKHPSLFSADTERSQVVTSQWRAKLGRDETAFLEDRLGDLGIDESELPFVVVGGAETPLRSP